MPEIDDAELARLKKLEQRVGAILKDPSARKKLAAAVKHVDPKDAFAAEADVVDPIDQRFNDLQAELAAERKARETAESKRDTDNRLAQLAETKNRGIAALRADRWTDEGIKGVEKLMEEKGILDPLDAAAIYERDHPPQMPITPTAGSGGWNFMAPPAENETDLKALIDTKGENISLVDKMAWGAIAEVRGASPRR